MEAKLYMTPARAIASIAIIASATYLGVISYKNDEKLKDICKKLDTTVDKLIKEDDITINQQIVDSATEKAATKASKEAIDNANKALVSKVSSKINDKLETEINNIREQIEPMVKKQLENKVADIDIYELRRDVKKEVKERIVSKLAVDALLK
jgi:uncharacterized membrane protein YheB (UPF0754 family)